MRLLIGLGGDAEGGLDRRSFGEGGYFTPLAHQPELARALWATVTELRMSGLRAADITDDAFESPAKHTELQALVAAYEAFLTDNQRGDRATVFAESMQHPDWCPIQPQDCWTELPDTLWSPLERHLMDTMPGERLVPEAFALPGAGLPRRLKEAPVARVAPNATAPLAFLLAPVNMIGGFGLVSYAQRMPEWLAWECFGRGNGATTLEAMSAQIQGVRDHSDIRRDRGFDQIGCIILSQPVFFPPELWIPQPLDWGRANLRYKRYDLTVGEGLRVWNECRVRAAGLSAPVAEAIDAPIAAERFGAAMTIRPRLGQGVFRLAVTDAYGRACAVTHEHALPVLEAAHIKPYGLGGEHSVNNGLLLRSDLHRLFDKGYVTVTPERRFEVSALLKEHFSNGRSYYPLHGTALGVPRAEQMQRMRRCWPGTTSTCSGCRLGVTALR
jgi:putative restriction endonuclease